MAIAEVDVVRRKSRRTIFSPGMCELYIAQRTNYRMNAKLKIALTVVWAAGVLGAAAPTTTPKPAPAAPAHKAAAAPAKPDAEVEAEIRRRFARSKVNEDKFTVKVRGGVATIEGRTNVPQRKGSATRMAKSAGARTVVNQIQVSEAARQKAAQNLAKRRVQVAHSDKR